MPRDQQLDEQEYRQRHFHRPNPTPEEEAMAREEEAQLEQILDRLHPDDVELLQRHFAQSALDRVQDLEVRFLTTIERIIQFACLPANPCKIWGVIYALDLSMHDGRNMDETARRIGSTRAAISIHAREVVELLNIPPSRWMRGEQTAERSKSARTRNLRPAA